jgi:hypothetical protein
MSSDDLRYTVDLKQADWIVLPLDKIPSNLDISIQSICQLDGVSIRIHSFYISFTMLDVDWEWR